MILTIPMELEAAKKEVMVSFNQIEKEKFNLIKKNILNNLGITINDTSNFIWEQFIINSSIYGEFAWQHIAGILPTEECYLFFNQIECKNAYLFKNSKDLCDIIGETYNCEIYVTDYNRTYIICYNHEMSLCGCGKAKQWIDDFKIANGIM